MKAIWDWLNGNKTAIGGVLLWLVTRSWFVELASPPVIDVLDYLSQILLGGGLLHKGIKVAQPIETKIAVEKEKVAILEEKKVEKDSAPK